MIATLFAFIGKKGYVFFFLPESNVSVEEADLILSSFFFTIILKPMARW